MSLVNETHDPALQSWVTSANVEGGDFPIQNRLETQKMRESRQSPARLSGTSFRHGYWTIGQMVAHHTVNGCSLRPGDLFGSGTESGPTPLELGSMLDLSAGGKQPITLQNSETRTFLEDHDCVILRGWCEKPGAARIGFGECRGMVLPSRSD